MREQQVDWRCGGVSPRMMKDGPAVSMMVPLTLCGVKKMRR